MKIYLPWLTALIVAVVTPNPVAADDWKTYRYPQDGFAASFPTAPASEDQKPDPQRMVRFMHYISERSDIAFAIGAALFHHKIIASDTPKNFLQGVVERVKASHQCDVRSQRALSFPGATALETVFDKCQKLSGGSAKQRTLLVGDRVYQVMVLGAKPGTADGDETKRFLELFSLIAQ